jgi:hypothetical protein
VKLQVRAMAGGGAHVEMRDHLGFGREEVRPGALPGAELFGYSLHFHFFLSSAQHIATGTCRVLKTLAPKPVHAEIRTCSARWRGRGSNSTSSSGVARSRPALNKPSSLLQRRKDRPSKERAKTALQRKNVPALQSR